MVVFSKFLAVYLLMIHSMGIVIFLGNGEVNKLPNCHGRKVNKSEEGHNQNQYQL